VCSAWTLGQSYSEFDLQINEVRLDFVNGYLIQLWFQFLCPKVKSGSVLTASGFSVCGVVQA
jgi:hypothetical protein